MTTASCSLAALLLLLLVLLCCCCGQHTNEEVFRAYLTSDQIVHTAVHIEGDVDAIHVAVEAQPSSFSPKLLIRRDGVPSPTVHDASFDIPPLPQVLVLTDHRVGPCTLFMGVFGGELLHSRRYFAGSPQGTTVLVRTTKFYSGETVPALSNNSSAAIAWNGTVEMEAFVADTLNVWRLIISSPNRSVDAPGPSKLRVEAVHGSQHKDQEFNLDSPLSLPFIFELLFPSQGTWRVRLSWLPWSSAGLVLGRPTWRALVLLSPTPFHPGTEDDGVLTVDDSATMLLLALQVQTMSCSDGYASTPGWPACSAVLARMAVSKSLSSSGNLVYASPQLSLVPAGLVVEASLRSPLRGQVVPGGTMTLTVRFSSTNGPTSPIRVLARLCNLPAPMWASFSSLNSSQSDRSHRSEYVLSSGARTLRVEEHTLHLPLLPGLWDDDCTALYVAIAPLNSSLSPASVSVQMRFAACAEGVCRHARCVLQRDDVAFSSCLCTYPYAGEACDTLTMPFYQFALQVLVLTASNGCAWPCVALCWSIQLFVPAVALALSALASAMYHLCDTDAYCLLPFAALQTLDVLLSLSAIFVIGLLLAPISARSHAAWAVACLATMCGPVAADPTNALNVVVAIAAAGVICVYMHAVGHMAAQDVEIRSWPGPDGTLCIVQSPMLQQPQQPRQYLSVSTQDDGPAHGTIELGILGDATLLTQATNAGETVSAGRVPWWRRLWLVAAGGVAAACGLLTFALQSSGDYWAVHSMWHVLMMLAAYCVVRGRADFLGLCGFAVPRAG